MTDARVHGEAVEALGVGTPAGQVHGEAVEALGAVPADGRVHGLAVEFLGVYIGPPNVPTNVSGVPFVFSAALSWDPPVGGYPVAYYQVRVDGGPWVNVDVDTLDHLFTALTPDTDHTLDVRAVNNGGTSATVSDVVHTFAAGDTPPGYYRVEVTLGGHSWLASNVDGPELGIVLPVFLGWTLPDEVDYFPTMADPTSLQFGVLVDDVATLADVGKGTTCTFRMFVQVDETAEPWQTFDGVVTQMRATRLDHDGGTTLITVQAGDDNMRLADIPVGYTADWPQESIYDRLVRIAAEAGVAVDFFETSGMEGILAPRNLGVTNALAAIRDTIKDAAADTWSYYPNEYWGRYVFHYQYAATDYQDANTLVFWPFWRRVYTEGDGPGTTRTLDGGLVEADGEWTKLPKHPSPTWGIVDGTTFGTPDGTPPFVRNTSFVDTLPGYNPSAQARDNLGESLLPDGSTQLDGWYAREVTYRCLGEVGDDHLADVLLVTGWPSFAPYVVAQPVVLENVAPRYRLNGEDYLAGTLTGARLVIPPGGRYYVTLRLRPELLPGTELPA